MDRLKERIAIAHRALGTLEELLEKGLTDAIIRDAAIQRFEYTFEALWKLAQRYLQVIEGIELASPRAAIRASFQVGLLDESQTKLALEMTDDRNLTTHTHNESLADTIGSHLGAYATLMRHWLSAIEQRKAVGEW